MKFQYFSDLHSECVNNEPTKILPPEKLLKQKEGVVFFAGDILVLKNHNDPSKIFQPYHDAGIYPLYIPGNHEFYHSPVERMIESIKNNTRVLENDEAIIIMTPLWSHLRDEIKDEVRYCIADFSRIKGHTTEIHNEMHAHCKAFVVRNLEKYVNDKRKKIVVTHFTPSFNSVHSKWQIAGGILNEYFSNNMDDVILEYQPDVWIHGHTHDSFDYTIGKTRVLCNPCGYPNEKREGTFHFDVVEI